MMMRLAGAALGTFLLAGCANNPYRPPKMPNTSMDCVASIATLTRTPLQALTPDPKTGKPISPPYVDFADVSQCLRPPGAAPEAVALYAIDTRRPLELKFKLLLTPVGTLPAAVSLLDANFRIVRAYTFGSFTHRGGEYSLPVFLNLTDASIRYALVTPDPNFVGKDDQIRGSIGGGTPVSGPGFFFMIYTGHETRTTYPFTLGGHIAVSASTEVSVPIVAPRDQ